MKNNGFTLIELLGVIVVLTILSLITIPIIEKSLNQGKKNISKVQEQQLIKGLKNYYAENINELNEMINGEYCKDFSFLKENGYLPESIDNSDNDGMSFNGTKVCVNKEDNHFSYYVK